MQGDVGLVLEDAKGFSHVLWKKNLEDILGLEMTMPSLRHQIMFFRVVSLKRDSKRFEKYRMETDFRSIA
jgi:hypothetical protein